MPLRSTVSHRELREKNDCATFSSHAPQIERHAARGPAAHGDRLLEKDSPGLADVESAQEALQQEAGVVPGQLTWPPTYALAEEVSRGTRRFQRLHPAVRLRVFCTGIEGVGPRVSSGESDVAVTLEAGPEHRPSGAAAHEPAGKLDFLLTTPPCHPLRKASSPLPRPGQLVRRKVCCINLVLILDRTVGERSRLMWRTFAGMAALILLLGATAAAQRPAGDAPVPNRAAAPAAPGLGSPRLDAARFLKDYDRNGDGALQRDEVPPYVRDHFDQLDQNRDGKLSPEELERGQAHLQPRRRPSDLVYVLVETSDCDDGCTGELQRMYDVLRKLDRNQNGKIEPEELVAVRKDLLAERVDHIFQELDANKDGRISREEARGPVREDFDRIDRNHDGSVERAELLQAASERPPARREK